MDRALSDCILVMSTNARKSERFERTGLHVGTEVFGAKRLVVGMEALERDAKCRRKLDDLAHGLYGFTSAE